MVPTNEIYGDDGLDDGLTPDFEVEAEPSLTYAMKVSQEISEDSIFVGRVDDKKAIEQAVIKIINTERYEYEIYSWAYGIELKDLFGQQITYVMSEVQRRIEDAVLADDRIGSIEDFEVERTGKHGVHCSFTTITVQGDEINIETEVSV